MRAFRPFIVLALPLVFTCLGCSSSSPAPLQVAPKIAPDSKPDFPTPPKPAQSEPAAKALLEKTIAAHTSGDPSKLLKFKTCIYTRSGTLASGETMEWKTDIAWPDRFRLRAKVEQAGFSQNSAFGSAPKPWRFPPLPTPLDPTPRPDQNQPLDESLSKSFWRQFQEDSMFLLFPLLDPATVVALGEDVAIGETATTILKVWTPGVDYAELSVDKKTSLIQRMKYRGEEQGVAMPKMLTYSKFQTIQGVQLPTDIEVMGMLQAPQIIGRWNKVSVDPVKEFDTKTFESR